MFSRLNKPFPSVPTVRNSFLFTFSWNYGSDGGGFLSQQEDNASWKCHVRAAVHRPGNVGWMMTGEELRGDDSRGTKLERVP